jgi:hypothetical protein
LSRVSEKTMDIKKAYYYLICLGALFFLFWGLVDLSSSAFGLSLAKGAGVTAGQAPVLADNDPSLDVYYQKKMLYDRLSDSLARVVIAGLVFAYCRTKAEKLGS